MVSKSLCSCGILPGGDFNKGTWLLDVLRNSVECPSPTPNLLLLKLSQVIRRRGARLLLCGEYHRTEVSLDSDGH